MLIQIAYQPNPERQSEFLKAVQELSVERYKDGAYQWGITQCTEEAGVFLEYFFVESWQEHLRQHQRVSCADAMLQEEILGYLQPDTKPVVRHYLTACQG